MILPFSTKLNGKPTCFVEKINACLLSAQLISQNDLLVPYNDNFLGITDKLHTIREDKNNRWKAGVIIDFFINTRTKDMFRFAPRVPVVSTQKVEIFHNATTFVKDGLTIPAVYIDGYSMAVSKITELAHNDGFDTIEDFFEYFDKDFSGKIIHWTDKKY